MQDVIDRYPLFDPDGRTKSSTDLEQLAPLIVDAIAGNQHAWRELHRRYNSLISAIARQFRLSPCTVDDVTQAVWLQLVLHLKDLRDHGALPGWIVTITRNEAIKILKSNRRWVPVDPLDDSRLQRVDLTEPDENLHKMEQRQAVRVAIGELRPQQQELIRLLQADPQVSYSEISRRLGMPIGSIGPTRARCLARLRSASAMQAFSSADSPILPSRNSGSSSTFRDPLLAA